jgi:hypothetical protein
VPGNAKPGRTRFADRIEEEFRLQRVVGDLDEINLQRDELGNRLVHIGLGTSFQRALPDRFDALDLGAGT